MHTAFYSESSNLSVPLHETGSVFKSASVNHCFTVDQTSIAENKNVTVLKSSDSIPMSSNICVALTEEQPNQFTYGAMSGLWFTMALNITHVGRKLGGREEQSIIAPYDVCVAGTNMPVEVKVDSPVQAVHIFLKQSLVDEVKSELYHSSEKQFDMLPIFAKNDTSLSMLMRVLKGTLTTPALKNQLHTDYLARALAADFLSKYVDSSNEALYKHSVDRLKPSQLRRVLEYMQENLASDIGINDLAVIAGVSRTNFIRRFKVSMHCTPARYLYLLRIRNARELLRQQDLPISHIAIACGFADPAHLSVSFKREVGMTPSAFRKEYNE